MAKGESTLKILAFGDSVTAGYRLATSEAYPSQLEMIMKKEGLDVAIVNAGVSGDTSAQGLRRIDWNTKNAKFDWVLLCLGANDGLRQLPVREMKKNLEALIEKIQAKKINILLLGMKLPENYSPNYRKEFEAVFPSLAEKYHLDFLPFILENVALVSKYTLEDLIHPNLEGHKIVAQNIWKILKPRVATQKEKPGT